MRGKLHQNGMQKVNNGITTRRLTDAIKKGTMVPVVGAGVSAASAPLPGWAKLVQSGIDYADDLGGCRAEDIAMARTALAAGKLIDAARMVKHLLHAPGRQFAAWLEDTVRVEVSALLETPLLDCIVDLLCPLVATTNYDNVLEIRMPSHFETTTWRKPNQLLTGLQRGDMILHLHGYYAEPESVVFGIDDYEELVKEESYRAALQTLWLDRTLLFLGCSFAGLEDPDFSRMLSWFNEAFPNASHRHYAMMLSGSFTRDQQEKWLHECRVQVLPYGPTHNDLPAAIRALNPNSEKAKIQRLDDAKKILQKQEPGDIEKLIALLRGAAANASDVTDQLRHAATTWFESKREDRSRWRHELSAMQKISRTFVTDQDLQRELGAFHRGHTAYTGTFRETVQKAAAALFLYPDLLLHKLKLRGIDVHGNVLSGYCRMVFENAKEFRHLNPKSDHYQIENLYRILTTLAAILSLNASEVFPDPVVGRSSNAKLADCLLVARQNRVDLLAVSSPQQPLATLPVDSPAYNAEIQILNSRPAVFPRRNSEPSAATAKTTCRSHTWPGKRTRE